MEFLINNYNLSGDKFISQITSSVYFSLTSLASQNIYLPSELWRKRVLVSTIPIFTYRVDNFSAIKTSLGAVNAVNACSRFI